MAYVHGEAAADDPGEVAAQVLADLVPRLARVIAGALESDPEVSLSLRQYRILERLADRPHRTTELATTSGVTQPTASAAVTSLESRALVVRRPDPEDRRATLIVLTDAGRAVLDRAHRRLLERLAMVTAGMSAADAAALRRLQPALMAGMDRARDARRSGSAPGPTPTG